MIKVIASDEEFLFLALSIQITQTVMNELWYFDDIFWEELSIVQQSYWILVVGSDSSGLHTSRSKQVTKTIKAFNPTRAPVHKH